MDVPGNVAHLSWIGFNPTSCYTGALPLPSLHLWKEQSNRASGWGVDYRALFLEKHLPFVSTQWENSDTGWKNGETVGPFNGKFDGLKNNTARRRKKNLILTLSFLSFVSYIHTNTFQSRRGMTADQCEHSQPHKWKWLICHSSILGGIFLSFTQGGEWTPFGWRPSLLIAHSPKAWRLENIFCVCDKAQNHSLFVTALFLFLTFMLDTMFLNGFLFSFPFLTDNATPF